MKIKVLCLGRSAKEIEVQDGTTVEQAIQQAEFPKDSSYTRHVNGSHCMDSDILQLSFLRRLKGGMACLSRHVSSLLVGQTFLSPLNYSKIHRFSSFPRRRKSSNIFNISNFSRSQASMGR